MGFAASRITHYASRVSASLPPRPHRFIQQAMFLNLCCQFFLVGGQLDCLLGGGDGLGKTTSFGIGGGERVQSASVVGLRQLDRMGGETHGLWTVAVPGL